MGKKSQPFPEQVICLCMGSSCKKKGNKEYYSKFKKAIKANDLKGKVELLKIDCTDRCDDAPILTFQPQNEWFKKVKSEQAEELFENFVLKQK